MVVTLLWNRGAVPQVPVIPEVAGLASILLAPGLAVEPVFRQGGWTLVERLGFAAAVSVALTALVGIALHLASLSVTTTNVLLILLTVSAVLGIVSLRYRSRSIAVKPSQASRFDVVAGIGSVALLSMAFVVVLVVHARPAAPPLEVALVDDAGSLLVLPLRVHMQDGTQLNIAVRSQSGATEDATVSVLGDGLPPWTKDDVHPTADWSLATVPIAPLRTGVIESTIEVRTDQVELRLPIEIEVAP
jgi:hypothetical protein